MKMLVILLASWLLLATVVHGAGPNLSDHFPPGRPSRRNLANMCGLWTLEKDWNLPDAGDGSLRRQGEALNRLKAGLDRCCQRPLGRKLKCIQARWEKVLNRFCEEELSAATSPHSCCTEPEGEARFTCFANRGPFPGYIKAIEPYRLAEVTPSLLDQLCGQFALRFTQEHFPALVMSIKNACCQLQGDERTQCAQEEKSRFVVNLCNSPEASWRDATECCSQAEDAARLTCFDSSYLSSHYRARIG